MKVFTVGLDDKEKAQKSDVEKADPPKVALDSPPAMPVPAPIIVPRAPPPYKGFGCGVLSWIAAAFLIVLLCLTILEITYNRQREHEFFRLKWAELHQHMHGFDFLSRANQQMQQPQPQIQQPVNELPAFPRRQDSLAKEATTTTTTPEPTISPATKEKENPMEEANDEVSPKFELLRMLLSRMREHAEEMGLKGNMQVHVVEVRPILANQMPQQAIDDAFGEVAMPRQFFGPWRNPEDYNDFGNQAGPWQFDRDSIRPSPWSPPVERFNRWDGPQFPQDNQAFGPVWDAPEGEPQMRITHHFDKDSQTPQRVVTEVFGENAPEVIGHILGQKNAQAQLEFQQQQQQEFLMQQQQPPLPQWPQPAQPFVQPIPFHPLPQPQPWVQPQPQPQPQFWEPPRFDQPPHPMVLFLNHPMNQAPFQQPALPPFQPSIGEQNQFPFPVQNQAPIFPHPMVPDMNNNVNTFNDDNVNPKPWYMSSGDEQTWQQTWENTPIKIDTVFNPHPAAAAPWVDNTAAVAEQHPAVPEPPVVPDHPTIPAVPDHPAVPVVPEHPVVAEHPVVPEAMVPVVPDQHIGHDSEGIDGFPREEKFNVPIDISADVEPTVAENAVVPPEPDHPMDTSAVNPWQHAQPEAAEEPMVQAVVRYVPFEPASVPVVSDPSIGPAEDKDFLPLRDSEEVIGHPLEDAHKVRTVFS
ncbi:hypothetical protein ANCCAN_15661 [Ancylostoma caninum]|uniref:Uncharacterized protein n=1 Tax=Ancylostoma caninum TaxID=29170 RepID=A0A368G554_ANCCA|nr:hypothetical protein ANCCAN_15661 [Ancylostoma caninum]